MDKINKKILEWLQTMTLKIEDRVEFETDIRSAIETIYCKLNDMQDDLRLIKRSMATMDRGLEELENHARNENLHGIVKKASAGKGR